MKSVLMIGLGRFGIHMAEKLIALGNDVLAVDMDEQRANAATAVIQDVQIGDATNEAFLRSLGIKSFDVCMVAIGDHFQAALETVVLLSDLGAGCIVARADSLVHKKLLLRNGAHDVIYAEQEAAHRLAVKYSSERIFDYFELTEDYAIYEIELPDGWVGKTVVEKAVRTKYGVTVLATKKNGAILPHPDPHRPFEEGETLMVLGKSDAIRALTR